MAIAQPVEKNQVDSLGRKQGYWKKYSKDTLKYEGHFNDDIPVGDFTYYYYNGNIKAKTSYSENGKIAKTIMYFSDGKKNAEGTYVNKLKDGVWLYYGRNSKVISEEYYKNGVKNGIWKYYYENGKINRIETYKNNAKNGEWFEFFEDSILKAKGTYMNDMLNGIVTYNNTDGKVSLTGKYVNDLKEGEWMFFNPNGQGERKLTYKNSMLIKEEIILKTKAGSKNINPKDVAFCESAGPETKVRLNSGEEVMASTTIDTVERLLGQVNYFRVNNNFIVALWAIKNRKSFNKDNPELILNPDPGKKVLVDFSVLEGFLYWAAILKYN